MARKTTPSAPNNEEPTEVVVVPEKPRTTIGKMIIRRGKNGGWERVSIAEDPEAPCSR